MPLAIRKRGKYWHARGTIPARQADGTIRRIRIEESLRTESKVEARKRASDFERHYHDLAYGRSVKRGPTFAEAALTYLQTRGKHDRFIPKLLKHFGETPIEEIDQEAVSSAAHVLYPGRSASTHNRAVYAPIVTILRLSGWKPDFRRPRISRKPFSVPGDEWFDALLPHCPPRLSALIAFITLTGRRITEALEAIDNGDGTCTIGRSKTGNPVVCSVPRLVVDLLVSGGVVSSHDRLFPFGDRHNVYRALRKACQRAGVPYYGTHAIGRHAFATRLLREGKSLKFVADAGGWASIKMPAQHYAHLEKSEVQDQVREVQEKWSRKRTTKF